MFVILGWGIGFGNRPICDFLVIPKNMRGGRLFAPRPLVATWASSATNAKNGSPPNKKQGQVWQRLTFGLYFLPGRSPAPKIKMNSPPRAICGLTQCHFTSAPGMVSSYEWANKISYQPSTVCSIPWSTSHSMNGLARPAGVHKFIIWCVVLCFALLFPKIS